MLPKCDEGDTVCYPSYTSALRRDVSLLSLGLGCPTAPPSHGSTLLPLQPHLGRLVARHPVRTPDRRPLRITLHEAKERASIVVIARDSVPAVAEAHGVVSASSVHRCLRGVRDIGKPLRATPRLASAGLWP